MLPEKHTLPTNLYKAEKLLRMLKMPYDKIHVCLKGCVLFRKEHKDANYCPKCKSSRYLEVDSGDGQRKAASDPRESATAPSFPAEDPTAIHDRGIQETDDMAQRWQTVQSWEDGTSV